MIESRDGSKGGSDRPSQVTMAGWVAIVGSALLVLTLFDSMSRLHSIETREMITDFLGSPLGDGLGLSVPNVVEILQGLTLFAGASAAVTLVLGVYVLQRNKGARIGFTVAAVGVVVTTPIAGGFLPVLIAFAAGLLWTAPARDWFAGRTPATRPARARDLSKGTLMSTQDPERPSSEHEGADADSSPSTSPDQSEPPPTVGYGAPPGQWAAPQQQPPPQDPAQTEDPYQQGTPYPPQYPTQYPTQDPAQHPQYPTQYPAQYPAPYQQQPYQQQGYPPPYQQQYQQPYGYPQTSRDPDKRPRNVTIAAWLTWVFSGLTLLFLVFVLIALVGARDEFLAELRSEPEFQELNIDSGALVAAVGVAIAVLAIWCLSAILLGVLAFRRRNWARIMLVVSASMTVLVALVAIGSIVSVLHLVAAGAVLVLLFTGGANQWYASKGSPSGYPPYPPGGGYGGYGGGAQPQDRPHGQPGQGEQEPPKNVW